MRTWYDIKLHRCQVCQGFAQHSLRLVKDGNHVGMQYFCAIHKEEWEAAYQADYAASRGKKKKNNGVRFSSVGMVGVDSEQSPYQRVVSAVSWAQRMRKFR